MRIAAFLTTLTTFTVLLLTWRASIPVGSYILVSTLEREALENLVEESLNRAAVEPIYPALNAYRLLTQSPDATARAVLDIWLEDKVISHWQEDGTVAQRLQPNDDLYSDQWGMPFIGMEDAWEVTTGGLTPTGDTIVIAALDYGFDLSHRDLASNIWINRNEIPGDGLDNDNNGYVDDYRGYSTANMNDDHVKDNHGNGVLGIIGARGNNAEGVAGVNWNVKLLTVSGIDRESDVIEGYGYIRQMRQAYNDSNGEQGAFIVASNFSAGIDGAFPEEHPIWCNLYDDLGSLGVINIASATNRESDVDYEGDIPTLCPSAFLITVTNINRSGDKDIPAGFGLQSVDLGAPGAESMTTDINQAYYPFGGTSAAAPHVAGIAGLLYSAPCSKLDSIARNNPAEAALVVRNAILESVMENTSLVGRSVTGGHANAADALDMICSDIPGPSDNPIRISAVVPNPSQGKFELRIDTEQFKLIDVFIYDAVGRLVYRDEFIPESPQIIRKIDLASGIPGVYYAELRQDDDRDIASIVVQ